MQLGIQSSVVGSLLTMHQGRDFIPSTKQKQRTPLPAALRLTQPLAPVLPLPILLTRFLQPYLEPLCWSLGGNHNNLTF